MPMKHDTNDPLYDTLYDPISYFGKENTRRTKRAREKKPKKVIQAIPSKSEHTLRSNGRGHNQKEYLRSLKRDLEMEPKVYYG